MVLIVITAPNGPHSLVKSIFKEVLTLDTVTFPAAGYVCANQEDVFSISAVDLGALKKLRIRHDNSQASAGWFLDRVEIIDNKDDST